MRAAFIAHFPIMVVNRSQFSPIIDAFSEVQCTYKGDVRRLPEDRIPPGETGGPAACLPHKLLPLCPLQHKTQVIPADCCLLTD